MSCFGDVRSLWQRPLHQPWERQERARDVARIIATLEEGEREEAIHYSRQEMGRHGIDTRYLDAYLCWEERALLDMSGWAEPAVHAFAAAREGFVGCVYSGDYQGDAMGVWRDEDGFVAVVMGYGSCGGCCQFIGSAENNLHGEAIFDVQRELESGAINVKALPELAQAVTEKGNLGQGSYYTSFFEEVGIAFVMGSETEEVRGWFETLADREPEWLQFKEQ